MTSPNFTCLLSSLNIRTAFMFEELNFELLTFRACKSLVYARSTCAHFRSVGKVLIAWFSYFVIHRRSPPMQFPDDRRLSPIAYDMKTALLSTIGDDPRSSGK